MNAVEIRGLTRTFPGKRKGAPPVRALREVDLAVPEGTVHGLLGPNGAGKTTLCRVLSTVLLPTAGTASVLGHDVVTATAAVKRSIGIVFGGDKGLYGRLNARQNLRFWAAMYGLSGRGLGSRVDRLLDRVGLTDRADHRVDTYSRGMKQRLHLARGLVADPRVLILDEPTSGMDPVAAHEFRDLVAGLRADGRTVLLTTHDMVEAEAVCDRVTLIDRGGVLASGEPATIGRLISHYERIEVDAMPEGLVDAVRAVPGVISTSTTGISTLIETENGAATAEVLGLLVAAGATSLRTGRPSLEEVYLRLVGGRGMVVG
ncbi:ABC transporter ATP-binding protein [Umezawaea sp.]|uniref:ABC transporter ATP-binding protein n=1 Tax=Umezawaea sp. TaxID=1955258 RepID=UPI002ED52006